jgi:hypothetical protein
VLLLTLAPSQHHSLVRQEHGRTIPLAAVALSSLWNGGARSLPVCFNNRGKGAEGSTLRQARLAQPVKTMHGILGVLVTENTLVAFNRETGVDPQHFGSLFPGLLKLSELSISGREPKMSPLQIG